MCDITYQSPDDLFRQIQSNPKLKEIQANPGFRAFSEEGRILARVWSITEPGNFAHPSIACRSVVGTEGSYRVKTELECFSTKANCDRLFEGYKRLDKQMIEEWKRQRKD
jgi:hypothetical protein